MLRKNIKRKDLIANVYFNIGFSKTISENIVYDIFNLFIDNIISNNVLKISNFGKTFETLTLGTVKTFYRDAVSAKFKI